MAKSVSGAFDEFMKNTVNLDSNVVSNSRSSRDNLLENIADFDNKDDFFELCQDFNVHYGSFARKTKCRELDDIDLMIGISASGATYNSFDPWNDVKIMASSVNKAQKECMREDGTLNSTQVANKFKKELESLNDYSRSEICRNGEAIVLNLKSKEWSFDIVPCFHTVKEDDGRSYYLIPNGDGNWKKTDPYKDKDHVTNSNINSNGHLLELIRLCKKWNKHKKVKTIPSYLLETMVVNFADSKISLSNNVHINFIDALKYIADHIMNPVYDMKEIQGDINNLGIYDKTSIKSKAQSDYEKACDANQLEFAQNQKEAIKMWGEIFGNEFPKYE